MNPNTPQTATHTSPDEGLARKDHIAEDKPQRKRIIGNYWALFTLIAFLAGLAGGYLLSDYQHTRMDEDREVDSASLAGQVNPSQGYALPAKYGDIGPQLVASGAIDYDEFLRIYQQSNQSLNNEQLLILEEGSDQQIVINRENAYFLLNFFWAFGLANQNPILTEGPMMLSGPEKVTQFASTGGWTLASKPVARVYASTLIVTLTPEQQVSLENVASQVYRPCCNNPTHFPDCNHGMAMLGLLELMAAQGASQAQMFEAAKHINAFWYPRQTSELATFFKATQKTDFDEINGRQLVGGNFSSASGFQNIHQWLVSNGKLDQTPGGGSSCGV
jgi:hypothetical protein